MDVWRILSSFVSRNPFVEVMESDLLRNLTIRGKLIPGKFLHLNDSNWIDEI